MGGGQVCPVRRVQLLEGTTICVDATASKIMHCHRLWVKYSAAGSSLPSLPRARQLQLCFLRWLESDDGPTLVCCRCRVDAYLDFLLVAEAVFNLLCRSSPATVDHYQAGMLLSGAGDALGYRNQLWEYNESGPAIHQELQELGSLKNISVKLPDWPVSDDTVLHLATAEALATGKEGEELLQEVASRYVEGMKDMEGRKPGPSSILGVSQLKPGTEGGYRIAYNPEGTGCGAAMRSMCIGLRYPRPEQLSSLVAVAVETGRMTHPHPTGFLGAVASALFTAYAVQRRPITTWGLGLVKEACPIAKEFVKAAGYAVSETERDWGYFSEKWKWYLKLRGLSSGAGPVVWPDQYGPAERDEVYKSFSLSGWAGRSGHDAPMIALDSLLGAGSNWEELMNRAGFHGGDSDSTAVIACCCWGLLYRTEGVPECNYSNLEYRDRLEKSAEKLYELSH